MCLNVSLGFNFDLLFMEISQVGPPKAVYNRCGATIHRGESRQRSTVNFVQVKYLIGIVTVDKEVIYSTPAHIASANSNQEAISSTITKQMPIEHLLLPNCFPSQSTPGFLWLMLSQTDYKFLSSQTRRGTKTQ